MADKSSPSAKGRKIGRSTRSNSHSAYNNSRRDLINAKRKQAKHAKACARKSLKVARGTARAKRRGTK